MSFGHVPCRRVAMASRVQWVSVAILLTVDCVLSFLIPLDIARCRVNCLPDDVTTPVKIPHHDQCWNTCPLLYSGEIGICNQSSNCDFGCQLACQFYYKNVGKVVHSQYVPSRTLSPHSPIELTLTPSNLLLNWSNKAEGIINSVYVILKQEDDKWIGLIQTMNTNCTLEREKLGSYLKLVAVDQSGMIGESSIVTNLENSTWSELLVSWVPSLIYFRNGGGDRGAEATIHWPTFMKSKKCEVIWMVMNRNIEITGHLYSEGNIASLTLWTNSVYSVQIKCYDSDQHLYAFSDPLILDTHGIEAEQKSCTISCNSISFVLFCCYFLIVGTLVLIFMSGGYCLQSHGNDKRAKGPFSCVFPHDKKSTNYTDSFHILPSVSVSSASECKLDLPCK